MGHARFLTGSLRWFAERTGCLQPPPKVQRTWSLPWVRSPHTRATGAEGKPCGQEQEPDTDPPPPDTNPLPRTLTSLPWTLTERKAAQPGSPPAHPRDHPSPGLPWAGAPGLHTQPQPCDPSTLTTQNRHDFPRGQTRGHSFRNSSTGRHLLLSGSLPSPQALPTPRSPLVSLTLCTPSIVGIKVRSLLPAQDPKALESASAPGVPGRIRDSKKPGRLLGLPSPPPRAAPVTRQREQGPAPHRDIPTGPRTHGAPFPPKPAV